MVETLFFADQTKGASVTADTLSGLLVPTFLGTATLTAFASVRNASISDRMRNAAKEIFSPDTTKRRGASLVRQLDLFGPRYRWSTYALQTSLIANTLAFFLVICSAFNLFALAAEILRFLGVLLLISVGFVFAEIRRSYQTLDEDVQTAIDAYSEAKPSIESPVPPA